MLFWSLMFIIVSAVLWMVRYLMAIGEEHDSDWNPTHALVVRQNVGVVVGLVASALTTLGVLMLLLCE